MARDLRVAPLQSRMFTLPNEASSHSAPDGVGTPTGMHIGPPTVERRAPVPGSTTWYSCGPQHVGPPPCVQVATFATTRLPSARHPIGQTVYAPVSLKIAFWVPPGCSWRMKRVVVAPVELK